MPSIVHSFSVKENDEDSEQAIQRLIEYANTKGVSFSQIAVTALKQYDSKLQSEKPWQLKKKFQNKPKVRD